MTNVGFATLDVIPDFPGFARHLERGTTPGLLAAGRTGGTKFGDVAGRSAGQRFGSVFRTAAKAGLFGALAVAAGAIKLGSDAIGEAREAQKVARQTRAVIKSTGGAAKVSAKDVGRLATNLSKMAGIDDEVVQGGENVLLTFKNIRNEQGKGNKVFDQATKASLDLSVALGKDLGSASLLVGKALNDPVAGMTALSRAGVQFSTDQKATIKTLVESGDTLGAQKIILRELKDEFAGSAKSQADSSDRLKVAWDNVKEALGKGLLPVVQDFSRFLLKEGVPAAEEFSDWFNKDGLPAIKDFATDAKPVAEKWLPKIADGFKTAAHFGKNAAGFAGDMLDAFDNMPGWVKKVLIGGVAGTLTAKKLGLTKIVGGSNGIFSKGATPLNPLNVFVVNEGFGGGTGGKSKIPVAPILKTAGTASLIGAIAGGVTLGVGKALGSANHALLGAGSGGTGGLPAGSHFFDLDEDKAKTANQLALERQAKFNEAFSHTKALIFDTKKEAQGYTNFINTRLPTEASIKILGWDAANAAAQHQLDLINLIRVAHVENQIDRLGHPTAGANGAAGGKDGDPTTPQRGVTIKIEKVEAQDVNTLLTDLQGRAWRASAGGSN